mmetsp:Transcript_4197/g.13383  ORF Transcript_4197/g.13383 Transcript_4197/m.13383 type:complete len:296 (+) Transcript_4197:1098-1985(+)
MVSPAARSASTAASTQMSSSRSSRCEKRSWCSRTCESHCRVFSSFSYTCGLKLSTSSSWITSADTVGRRFTFLPPCASLLNVTAWFAVSKLPKAPKASSSACLNSSLSSSAGSPKVNCARLLTDCDAFSACALLFCTLMAMRRSNSGRRKVPCTLSSTMRLFFFTSSTSAGPPRRTSLLDRSMRAMAGWSTKALYSSSVAGEPTLFPLKLTDSSFGRDFLASFASTTAPFVPTMLPSKSRLVTAAGSSISASCFTTAELALIFASAHSALYSSTIVDMMAIARSRRVVSRLCMQG